MIGYLDSENEEGVRGVDWMDLNDSVGSEPPSGSFSIPTGSADSRKRRKTATDAIEQHSGEFRGVGEAMRDMVSESRMNGRWQRNRADSEDMDAFAERARLMNYLSEAFDHLEKARKSHSAGFIGIAEKNYEELAAKLEENMASGSQTPASAGPSDQEEGTASTPGES